MNYQLIDETSTLSSTVSMMQSPDSVPPFCFSMTTEEATTASTTPRACMSFTAPQFSMEDEQLERESISEQEREALRLDLYGYAALQRETPDFLQERLAALQDYLQQNDDIPDSKKMVYEQALQECPDVVREESNPLFFLRAENYDAEAAAAGLVQYWIVRKAIWGNAAFQPLEQLEHIHQQQLKQQQQQQDYHNPPPSSPDSPIGNYILLPNDDMGRSVLFFAEAGHQQARQVNQQMLQRTFLLFHKLARDDIQQRHGCVIIVDARAIHPDSFNRKQYRRQLELLRAVPIPIRAVHVCFAAFKSPARLLQPAILWMYGRNLRLRRQVHYGACPQDLAQSLIEYGLRLGGLPQCIGGTFQLPSSPLSSSS